MGSTLWNQTLVQAIKSGAVKESHVDESIRRGYLHHFKAGRFDPLESVEWTKIGMGVVNSSEHRAAALGSAAGLRAAEK